MAKFSKKPVVIEAVQFTVVDGEAVFSDYPTWLRHALMTTKLVTPSLVAGEVVALKIGTLEDGPLAQVEHYATPGDWIIRGVTGELYPIKDSILKMTYDPA